MNRLTKRIKEHVYYTLGKYPETIPARCESSDVRTILRALAAYEDTGLTPEEITALRAQLERESEPEPLTLEELREMDGKPVWVEVLENTEANPPYWAIIDNVGYRSAGVDLISHLDKDFGAYELYGETWLAYPRKPREG